MRTLELFSGTQSFSKYIKQRYSADTVTVDIISRFNPTHHIDILEWDYRIYPPHYFDIIWASPPCTQYSVAKTQGIRDLEGADTLVRKAFEIIDYFEPKQWILENVGTGLLVTRMKDIRACNMYIADYCAYGKSVRKRTAFWSNVKLELLTCPGKNTCPSIVNGRHISSVGNGLIEKPIKGISRFEHRNSIPRELIEHIVRELKEKSGVVQY
jgi:site-specific DNA-cytosine methylase